VEVIRIKMARKLNVRGRLPHHRRLGVKDVAVERDRTLLRSCPLLLLIRDVV
jgi:hypothetical protein